MNAFARIRARLQRSFARANAEGLPGLLAVPSERRDAPWRERFYAAILDAPLIGFEPPVEYGPDDFPYLQLAVPADGAAPHARFADMLDRCLHQACGIALFADARRADPPAWVFTYGELLSYRLYGRFDGDPAEPVPAPRSGVVAIEAGREVVLAQPSESYLPAYARKALDGFFRDTLRHPDPRIVLVIDPQAEVPRSLMVNLTPDDYGGDFEKLRAALHYLRWFLPEGYGLRSTMPGQSLEHFRPLA